MSLVKHSGLACVLLVSLIAFAPQICFGNGADRDKVASLPEQVRNVCSFRFDGAGNVISVSYYGPADLVGESPEFQLDLRDFPSLKHVLLRGHFPSEREMEHIATLRQIDTLELGEWPHGFVLTLAHLRPLQKMIWLKELQLTMSDISDEGMRVISQMKGLEALMASGNLTDKAMRYVSGLSRLEHLDIGGDFSDHGMRAIQDHKSLETLVIRSGSEQLTEEAYTILESLPRLKNLRLRSPGISRDAAARGNTGAFRSPRDRR